MKEITPGLPVKVVVDVLRQASKVNTPLASSRRRGASAAPPPLAGFRFTCVWFFLQACVVKREFRKAEQLIKHAVFLAR